MEGLRFLRKSDHSDIKNSAAPHSWQFSNPSNLAAACSVDCSVDLIGQHQQTHFWDIQLLEELWWVALFYFESGSG